MIDGLVLLILFGPEEKTSPLLKSSHRNCNGQIRHVQPRIRHDSLDGQVESGQEEGRGTLITADSKAAAHISGVAP